MESKRLFRSRTDVMLGGVCGGLAKYLNVDPTVIRLVFVLLLFIGGGGFWIYLVLWFITPVEPASSLVKVVEVKANEVKTAPSITKMEDETQVKDSTSKPPVIEKVKIRVTKNNLSPGKPKSGIAGTPIPKAGKK
jgi:phage shock protein C